MTAETQVRAKKLLACTEVATRYQKTFGAELRRRVVDAGEPFAVAQADTPHEIFHAMDIPLVSNQWWSAYISAKRLSGKYFQTMDELGYPPNRCRYCSLGLGCTLTGDPASAPWGGLPRPTVLVARLTCDCVQQVFAQWAQALGTEFFALEAPAWQAKHPGLVPALPLRLEHHLRTPSHRAFGGGDAAADRIARKQNRPALRRTTSGPADDGHQ